MAAPAAAAAASSAGVSSTSAAALQAGVQAGTGIIGSMVQAPFAKRRQKRNMQFAKELMQDEYDYNMKSSKELADYNQSIYEKNRKHDEERQDYLNRNSKVIEKNALRDAGFNPAWAQEGAGSLTYQPTSVEGSASSSGVNAHPYDFGDDGSQSAVAGLFSGISDYYDKMYDLRLKDAQVALMKSQAHNLDSDTEGKDLSNDFFRNTKALKEQMTNGEYNQMLRLQDIYSQNPELLQAIASAQAVLNEKLSMETAKMETEIDEIVANVGRAKSEERLNHEKVLSEQLHRCLSQKQFQLMEDENFRANVSNPGYLVQKAYQIEHSNMTDAEKDEQLALVRNFLDECSGYSAQRREQVHESAMQQRSLRQSAEFHADEMEVKGAEILVRSFDTLAGNIYRYRKTSQRNSKKSDYAKKKGRESKSSRNRFIDIFDNQ